MHTGSEGQAQLAGLSLAPLSPPSLLAQDPQCPAQGQGMHSPWMSWLIRNLTHGSLTAGGAEQRPLLHRAPNILELEEPCRHRSCKKKQSLA